MRLIRGIHNLRETHRGCVATIGNFDGVHLGHQRILDQVITEARRRGLKSTVMLFEPQPQEFFAPDQAPPRLMSLRDKLIALREAGVDQVLCVRFNARFRALTAEAFVKGLLVDGLGVDYLVVGDDFRFGCGRDGDFAYLRQAGERFGFSVTDTATCEVDGERVSSTRIRAALSAGAFDLAAQLLGRPFAISGRVRHGDKIGRTLNLPTVNLALKRLQSPLNGVFAVSVSGAGLTDQPGAANMGTRPTVNGTENRLEVHLLDFCEEDDGAGFGKDGLYGKHLTVAFRHYVRAEEKFADLDQLKTAIWQDVEAVRDYFEKTGI
ncbi:MAG: bifunctional riboflavin kinase/FMN adenylyltransferase [Alcanivoracaceae bacterium]|uniref:bifunctional riboflavin kinase/FAD synthetase n=1 Tax=Alcanivorax sp. MD8A TaxID=1177157 RepID=UPI000C611A74|nr:bifunctional riboflavin kinase/FAD synthetase [Alcanivorax sp. MD8A]MAX55002.1 bifunctional riboflavin kinase/FMN adenylyltransferase [Alcanivoracaceae bacterium]PNE02720.1 FAD pyrophosphorylase [Alcanivorax sp. MD8A]|tara:strand:+ start:3036 stop:4001 length:966 start_codon:yes stop_codon:yes gene_type:complete